MHIIYNMYLTYLHRLIFLAYLPRSIIFHLRPKRLIICEQLFTKHIYLVRYSRTSNSSNVSLTSYFGLKSTFVLTLQRLKHVWFLYTFTSKYTRKYIRLMNFYKTFTIKDTVVSISDSIRLVSKPIYIFYF